MTTKKPKRTQAPTHFVSMIEEIRDELTTKISHLSASDPIDYDTTKLLKEMTAIVKELDRMVKESTSNQMNLQNCESKDSFYEFIKQQSLLKNNNNGKKTE